jgi:hypothetical protein
LSGYFLVCNLVLYAAIAFRERPNQVAQHLTVLSAAAALVEVPGAVWHGYWAASNPGAWMFCWAAAYALFAALISRNPKLGVAGAICAGFAAALLFRNFDATAPIALQVAFGFLLLHSIAWHDADERGAATARIMAAAGWVIHSLWWAHSQELFSFVVPATVSAAIACGCFALILLGKIPAPRVLLIAAAVVLISTPANLSLEKARTASPGVMFVVGSFVLFAVGTVFALGKHRWLKETPASKMTETAADDYPE